MSPVIRGNFFPRHEASGSVGLQNKPVNCGHKGGWSRGGVKGRRGKRIGGEADTRGFSLSSCLLTRPRETPANSGSFRGFREARGNLAFASTTNCARRRPTRLSASFPLGWVTPPRCFNASEREWIFTSDTPPSSPLSPSFLSLLMYTPCTEALPNLVRVAPRCPYICIRPTSREKRHFSTLPLCALRSLLIKAGIIRFARLGRWSFILGLVSRFRDKTFDLTRVTR